MLHQKINVAIAKPRYSAFSLIEILISIGLGSILLFLSASVYTDFYRYQNRQKEQLFLQKEAHQLLQYMQHHIQHLNYKADDGAGSNHLLFQHNGMNFNLINKQCFIFYYDVNKDGCIGKRPSKTRSCVNGEINLSSINEEVFGFSLKNKELYYYRLGKQDFKNCLKPECKKLLTDCSKMIAFTSILDYEVRKLSFNWKIPYSLFEIELELNSVKEKDISYYLKSYVFILNN